ncbi:hypothetical protein HHI36_018456 [Cryptolaemus montrouzieri]|uniref:Uncharacterized protein n=1 Tax=Cryptolaemus montrouzieri TaxID=559131 RepID=A0ABD2P070_9CUCU
MRDCPTKPANRMKLIRQQNDPTNPNTLGATFVQLLTKEIVPGNETEPEVIKENVDFTNAENMEENDNNMEYMDKQNATEIENSQESWSSADDREPKIDSYTEEVLNEGIGTDTSISSLMHLNQKKNKNKRRRECKGTSSSEEEKKVAK